jgi:hypothetical protein
MAGPKGFEHLQPEKFVVELVVDGKVKKSPLTALNQDSIIQHLTSAVNAYLPRISGYNLYNEAGKLLVSVNVIEFLAQLSTAIPELQSVPAQSPGGAGWRAVPVVTPSDPNFQKLVEQAREDGRQLKGGAPEKPFGLGGGGQ